VFISGSKLLAIVVMVSLSGLVMAYDDPMRPPEYMGLAVSMEKDYEVDLVLQMILTSEDRHIAVINNKVVNEGDVVFGIRVVTIDRYRVVIKRKARVITLSFPSVRKYATEIKKE